MCCVIDGKQNTLYLVTFQNVYFLALDFSKGVEVVLLTFNKSVSFLVVLLSLLLL